MHLWGFIVGECHDGHSVQDSTGHGNDQQQGCYDGNISWFHDCCYYLVRVECVLLYAEF